MTTPPRYARSQELLRRAQALIPGGTHRSGRPLLDPSASPMYFERGRGSHVWCADGHEYIDLFMAFGPFLLGYARPEVDAAAFAQSARGSLLSMNHPLHATFIEAVVARFPGSERGAFFRTGSEAATAALRIARRATGRRLVARCGYHGWHDGCSPAEPSVPDGVAAQVLTFRADEPATLAALFAKNPGEIAAVIVAPETVVPTDDETFHRLRDLTHAHGAVFVMDEAKTAFRTPPGSVQRRVGVVPDLTCVSKALGNGWPVAAVVGTRAVMECAAGLDALETHPGDTAAMAAAITTLDLIEREHAAEHAFRLGERLIEGMNQLARNHELPAVAYGEPLPPMPFFRFTHPDGDVNARIAATFYGHAFDHGVLMHPRHLWFMSLAHTDDDIDRVLDVCDDAMTRVRAEHPDAR
jgi:glutamate-1-semialdehyde aminotransferase